MADSFVNDTGLGKIWGKIKDALAGKAPLSHTHTKSQITDFPTSMPASDVYAWAKASSKPSYSISEIDGLQSSLDGKLECHQSNYTLNVSSSTDEENPTYYTLPVGTVGKVQLINVTIINRYSSYQYFVIKTPTTGRYGILSNAHQGIKIYAGAAYHESQISAKSTLCLMILMYRIS